MLSNHNRETLITYLNDTIDRHSKNTSQDIVKGESLIEPLGDSEQKALELIKSNPVGFKAILEKLFLQHSHDIFFDFLCIIDGVADPDPALGEWTGVLLTDMPKDFDEHVEFLHDEL